MNSKLTVDEARVVAKLHSSMGHPDTRSLPRLLGQQKVRPVIHEAVKGLRYEHCDRNKRPAPPPQVGLPRLSCGAFGEQISGDIFYMHLPTNDQVVSIMGWICHSTNLHVASVIENREPSHLLECLQALWLHSFGYPLEIWTDHDGGFRGCFSDHMTGHGVLHRLIPPESHHQLGKIERHNWLLKGVLVKLCDEVAASSVCEVSSSLIAALHAKSSSIQKAGFSPFSAAFGRHPRLPLSLLDEDSEPSGRLLGPRDPEYLRLAATKALISMEQADAIRSSQLR